MLNIHIFCAVKVMKLWSRLPTESVESLALEMFKHWLGKALSYLLWLQSWIWLQRWFCFEWGRDQMTSRDPFWSGVSVIQCYLLLQIYFVQDLVTQEESQSRSNSSGERCSKNVCPLECTSHPCASSDFYWDILESSYWAFSIFWILVSSSVRVSSV